MIERELGRGGAGAVYLAWEPALDRHVAVKLIPRNSLVDPHAREHWLAEARALSRVPHDHVVAIHRVDESEEWLWLVIEYVAGGTLKDRLTEPLPPRDAARLTEMIARTVAYFHARGVFHLDLKPSNVLLDGEPGAPWERVAPKVSDFGIARFEGEPGATQTGANGPKGTPSYMAPEQVAALPGTIGAAADIHALGALLYHLLTGRPPFQGTSTAETLDQVRHQDPVPPRRLSGRIARDLETICLTCLEKDPSRRYANAGSMARDLRLWLDGRPILARPVSPMGHAWRLCNRRPAVAGLLAALAMMLITGIAGLFLLLNRVANERARLVEARRQAEAYEQFSSSAADQILSFLRSSIPIQQKSTPEQRRAALLKLRSSTNELKRQGVLPSSTLGILEQEIGWALLHTSKPEEARDVLNQAVVDLKRSLASNPDNQEVQACLVRSLHYSGVLANAAGQFEDALNCFEQAAAIHMATEPTGSADDLLTKLYKMMHVLAQHFGESGQRREEERSRRLSRQILSHLAGSDMASSSDAFAPGLETLRMLFARRDLETKAHHELRNSSDPYEHFVAEWLVLSVGWLSPFSFSSSTAAFDQDPEAGSVALIAGLRDRCSKLGLAKSMVPAAFRVLQDDAANVAGQ